MTVEAQLHKETINIVDFGAVSAKTAGEVVQLADGRAGVVATGLAAGDAGVAYVMGKFKVQKTASVVLLEGQEVYWVKSTSKMNYTGDFLIGVMAADATAAATTGYVLLNVKPEPVISLDKGLWTRTETLGLGVVQDNKLFTLAMDAVAEAATSALYSVDTIGIAQGAIMEAEIAIYAIGDDAALDISAGLANGTHATDFDSVTEFAGIHLDGADLSVLVESDDGSTEVAATDSTVDAVDDAWNLLQVDARDLADVKVYWNGVDLGALATETLVLSAATGPLLPIVHVEKTNNDTVSDVRVRKMQVRTATTV